MLSCRTYILVSETALRDKIRNEEEKVLEQISYVSRIVYKWVKLCRQVHTLCSRPRKGIIAAK